ncbi:MAG: CHRD domain-containing protein, partial [Candidatus Bipolaricaulota bacterium]
HSVGNTSAHYVESVTVTRNGEKVVEEEYEEQSGRRESTYEYDLDAENGDLIEVRAVCNRFGDITGSLKIEGLSSDRESLFRAVLTQETPQLTVDEGTPASARGMAVVWIDPKENTLKYGVGFKELSGPPTAGEFVQLEGEDGIVLPIFGEDDGNETETPNSNSGFLTGKWEDTGGEPLTDELIAAILEGKVYLRFQTELNPEGELLGRLEVLS